MTVAVLCLALAGCKPAEHGHDHDGADDQETENHSHGDDAKSFSGAIHKEGKGITLLPETEKRLELQLAEVKEEALAKEIKFTARVFSAGSNATSLASGWISEHDAKLLSVRTPLKLRSPTGESFEGIVTEVVKSVLTSETEIIVQFTAGDVTPGTFLQATAQIESDEPVITVPREAVINGTTETFVYVQNGDAYLRTVVETGRTDDDSIEIKDGLLEGDSVVLRGAMDLWLVELRAVKGGQGCCPAPPTKRKKT